MTHETVFQAIAEGEGLDIASDLLMTVTLISVRIQAFLYLSPFFNKKAMLRTVRAGFVFAIAIILVPGTYEDVRATENIQSIFLGLIAKEFFIGLILGVVMWMPIRGLELTGTILDTQRGSMQAQSGDVVFGGQITPTGVFLLQLFSGYFFAAGGFRIVQNTLFKSAEVWPFISTLPPFTEEVMFATLELAGALIFAAIAFAIPISAMMLLADTVIAFLARTAPTLNALTFGMPVKSFIMCIMLAFYIEIAYPRILAELARALDLLERVF